jgi:hypothetical protein
MVIVMEQLQIGDYQMVIDLAMAPIQGTNIQVWHLILFLVVGPMVTWPMLIVLILFFFGQHIKMKLPINV